MQCNLYHTTDMKAAYRSMIKRNFACILRNSYFCNRPIRFRADIPTISANPSVIGYEDRILRWLQYGGVLVDTRRFKYIDDIPRCHAMLIPEAPMGYQECNHLSRRVSNEIIIYKPPNWELHEESVNYYWPRANRVNDLLDAVSTIKNKNHPLVKAAIKDSKFTVCFEELEGFNEIELRAILKLLPAYKRYNCYRPMISPEGGEDLDLYRKLESIADIHNGWRLTTSNAFSRLVKNNNVESGPQLHLIDNSKTILDLVKIRAIGEARRQDWEAMRTMIDLSPEYPI